MALGDAELAFLISSGIMLALFILVYYKLYRKPEVSRVHKVVYAVIFPSFVVLGSISIFVFQIFMSWDEVLLFNVVWIPLFLMMLQDLTGNPLIRQIPFVWVILAVLLIVITVICLVIFLMHLIWFLSVGELILSWPVFIVLALIIGPLLVLTARIYGIGEKKFTDGAITSGGSFIIYALGFAFACFFIIGGLPIYGEDHWMPTYVGFPMVMIGTFLLAYCLYMLEMGRREREEAGYG